MMSTDASTPMNPLRFWAPPVDSSAPESTSGPSAARVLIADDQNDVLQALRILLKNEGFEVELANVPQVVLERLRARPFDAVIMDLNYTLDTTSGAEGMDLLAAVRALDGGIPVVVMTAWATVDIAIEALRRGASDFIQKPWDNSQVLDTVRRQVRRHHRQMEELHRRQGELEAARSVQQALLPREIPEVTGVEVALWAHPAREVGGDYYDIIKVDDTHVGFVIADVCGKGIPAALTMSNLQGALKSLLHGESDPAALCRKLNQLLGASMEVGRFVSLFCGMLDTASGRFVYCNAGHQPPLAIARTGGAMFLQTGGAVLGHFQDWKYEQAEIMVGAGDAILLFTDGVFDARQPEGDEFGNEGIINAIRADRCTDAVSMCDAVTTAARRHCNDQFDDDATLVVVRRK